MRVLDVGEWQGDPRVRGILTEQFLPPYKDFELTVYELESEDEGWRELPEAIYQFPTDYSQCKWCGHTLSDTAMLLLEVIDDQQHMLSFPLCKGRDGCQYRRAVRSEYS